jgi:C4-dicarboxylate transporter
MLWIKLIFVLYEFTDKYMDKSNINNSLENREKKEMQYVPRGRYQILPLIKIFFIGNSF